MIWSPSRNFCFVHVPKTGGTAVEQAYKPHLRFGDVVLAAWRRSLDNWYAEVLEIGKHSSAAHIAEQVGRERFRQVFSYAILRDPLERLVSYYKWIQSFEHPGNLERWLRSHRSFEDFVEPASEHFALQADLVCDPETGLPMVTVLAPPTVLFTRTPSPSYTYVALAAPLTVLRRFSASYARLYVLPAITRWVMLPLQS